MTLIGDIKEILIMVKKRSKYNIKYNAFNTDYIHY